MSVVFFSRLEVLLWHCDAELFGASSISSQHPVLMISSENPLNILSISSIRHPISSFPSTILLHSSLILQHLPEKNGHPAPGIAHGGWGLRRLRSKGTWMSGHRPPRAFQDHGSLVLVFGGEISHAIYMMFIVWWWYSWYNPCISSIHDYAQTVRNSDIHQWIELVVVLITHLYTKNQTWY